jgi:HD superfamily phosphohydrolase
MLLDIVVKQRDEPGAKPDLFREWEREAEAGGWPYLKRVAEAIVLTRLGALLHDLCHVPFGHSVEDELRLLVPHDENRERFDAL